jgi:hypothetical protein
LKDPQPVKTINIKTKKDLLRLDFNLLDGIINIFLLHKYKNKFCAK